jgi:hypothetical protein
VKRLVTSSQLFEQCGYNWINGNTLANSYFDDIPTGSNLTAPPCP